MCRSQQLNCFLFLSALTGKSLSDDQTAALTMPSATHSLAKAQSRDCSTQCDEQAEYAISTNATQHTPAPSSGVYLTMFYYLKYIQNIISMNKHD